MNFLITGACGYIGSMMCQKLSIEFPDCKIYAFDNLYYSQDRTREKIENISNVEFYNQDVTKYSIDLITAINKANFILPLAAIVGAPSCDKAPAVSKEINYAWYETLVNLCQKNQKILYPNTNSGYGTTPADSICDEKTKVNPISLYAKLKQDTEDFLFKNYNDNSICFRLATVFGLSLRPRLDLLVNNFVYKSVFDKKIEIFDSSFRRNFVSINDVCRAFIHAINNFDIMKGNIYNLGTDSLNATKLEFAMKIKELTNCEIIVSNSITDKDKRDYIVSNKKLYATGFSPIDTELDSEVFKIIEFLNDNKQTDLSYTFNYS